MKKTAIFRNDLFMEHIKEFNHVESPERLRTLYNELDRPEISKNFIFPDFLPASPKILGLNPRPVLCRPGGGYRRQTLHQP